jgi:hypothetical protein
LFTVIVFSEIANAQAADIHARTHICGWRARSQGTGVVTYTSVFHTDEEGTDSSLDPGSGVFRAGRSGVYKVRLGGWDLTPSRLPSA